MFKVHLATLLAALLLAIGIYAILAWPYVALIVGWYVYKLFYPRLVGVMGKRHKGEQLLSFVLPWLLIGPLAFLCGMLLLQNPSYAAVIAYATLVAFEFIVERYWLSYMARVLAKKEQFELLIDIYQQRLPKFETNANLLYDVSSKTASITHHLAILHHRYAIQLEEEGQTEAAKPHWHNAIAYWVLLMEMDAFWEIWQAEREAVYKPIKSVELTTWHRDGLYERLRQVHDDFERAYHKQQQKEQAAEHQEYRLLLKLERFTAAALRKITEQLRQQGQLAEISEMPVYGGPLMLSQLGLLEQARKVAAIAQNTDIPAQMELAHMLADYLSPFGRWRILIEEQPTQQLIDELKTEYANKQTNPVMRRLLVRALIEVGKSLDSSREAISQWVDALKYEPDNQEAQSLLTEHCIEQATSLWQRGKIESAIELLTLALRYVPGNNELKQNLSALLTDQAKQYIQQGKRQEARENLQKAIELNNQNKIAKEMLANL